MVQQTNRDALFEKILVATDGTPASTCAIQRGIELGAIHDAKVHALYVVETELALDHIDFEVNRQEKEGEKAVEAVEQWARTEDVPVTKVFRYGRIHEEIVGYAEDHDTSVIVMGTHGRSGFARIKAAGSVAERVVRNASVPVMVIGKDVCTPSMMEAV